MSLKPSYPDPTAAAVKAADQQFSIQQQQLATSNKLIDTGLSAFNPAKDYWSALLKGGQPAQVAVAPAAQQVQASSEAAQRNIANSLPAGGERNLALAQAKLQQGSDISRLYAGVQPAAANALAQLAGSVGGQGVDVGAGASPATSSSISNLSSIGANNANNNAATASTFGSLIYRFMNPSPSSTPPIVGGSGKKNG